MAAAVTLDRNERARRAEFVREARAAALAGESTDQRAQKRDAKAADWSRWFRDQMERTGAAEPAELLPEAFAKLEQLAEDRAAAAVREVKAALRKALS
jgi:hypothetical protein